MEGQRDEQGEEKREKKKGWEKEEKRKWEDRQIRKREISATSDLVELRCTSSQKTSTLHHFSMV